MRRSPLLVSLKVEYDDIGAKTLEKPNNQLLCDVESVSPGSGWHPSGSSCSSSGHRDAYDGRRRWGSVGAPGPVSHRGAVVQGEAAPCGTQKVAVQLEDLHDPKQQELILTFLLCYIFYSDSLVDWVLRAGSDGDL